MGVQAVFRNGIFSKHDGIATEKEILDSFTTTHYNQARTVNETSRHNKNPEELHDQNMDWTGRSGGIHRLSYTSRLSLRVNLMTRLTQMKRRTVFVI